VVAFLASILRLMSGRRQVRRSGRSTDPWLVSTCTPGGSLVIRPGARVMLHTTGPPGP